MSLTKKQLALRKQALWASEIVGLFPEYALPYHRNILEIYAEKTGVGSLREHSNANTAAGDFLEKPIAELWAREHGKPKIVKVRESRLKDYGFPLGATPDFLVNPRREKNPISPEALECKYVHPLDGETWKDDTPYHVLLQCAVQALVWRFHVVHIAAWIGSAATRVANVYEPVKELEELIIERGKWFWEIVQTRAWHERLPELPEVHAEIKARFAARLFPGNTEPPVQADETDIAAFENYLALNIQKSDIESKMLEIRTAAALRMKNAGSIVGPDGKKIFYKKITPAAHVKPKPYDRKESVVVLANKPRNLAEIYEVENV